MKPPEPHGVAVPEIEELVADGRHAEAAALALRLGYPEEASRLFAAVWRWPEAIAAAEAAGRLALAYRHAVAAKDRAAIGRLLLCLADDPDEAREAIALALDRGRPQDAARLFEAAGDLDGAAESFERAGALLEAARCRELLGDPRAAGLLLERHLRNDPEDTLASLRLGRVLVGFGRLQHAMRALQAAERGPEERAEALRLLVACFAAEGLDEAARRCLLRLRESLPELPPDLPDYLELAFGHRSGLLERGDAGAAAELLGGRYRILAPLGAGATGRVVRAHDSLRDLEVAIKILTVDGGASGRDAFTRFAREARVAAGLDHPNVVEVYEYDPRGPHLVMEFMSGGTLEDRLVAEGGAGMPLAIVRRVLAALLDGLEAVHRRGVVHRDLKPANIFFGPTGEVKLGDFGVAHLADLGATLTGALLGTLAYMAPEQITGHRAPGASADLYALGVVLFRMLTGSLPFPGPDFLAQQRSEERPRVGDIEPALAGRFDALLEDLLALEPNDRPSSATEVRERLDSIDWSEPKERRAPEVERSPSRPRRASHPAPPASERYTLEAIEGDGTWLAFDRALQRRVRILEGEAALLRVRFAVADGPFLQAVYDFDPETGRCVLEEPDGEPPRSGALDEGARAWLREALGSALSRIHDAGLVHGQVDASRVRVASGRPLLLLPTEESSASPEDDRRGLAELTR